HTEFYCCFITECLSFKPKYGSTAPDGHGHGADFLVTVSAALCRDFQRLCYWHYRRFINGYPPRSASVRRRDGRNGHKNHQYLYQTTQHNGCLAHSELRIGCFSSQLMDIATLYPKYLCCPICSIVIHEYH